MNNRQRIFLGASLISIFALLMLSQVLEPKTISISNITDSQLNQQLKLIGKITSQKNFEGKSFQVLKIEDETGEIEFTTNSKTKLEINYSRNYTLIGKLTKYNESLQITADKIYTA